MKLHKTLFVAVALLVASMMFMGCWDDDSTTSSNENKSGVDFTSYSASSYVVKVRNNTQKKLVAFKGTPSADTLIGGIPATAANHGLPRSTSLFPSSTDFVLFIVTEDDYVANKSNLSALANTPFARLYAYYNSNAANNNVYEISSVMGGSGAIVLQNNTQYNVELRRNGIYGETIGYTSAETYNTTFSVEYGNYLLFPVFRKFDTTINEIVTVYPKYSSGSGKGRSVVASVGVTSENPSRSLNASEWLQTDGQIFSSAYAYITINNQVSGNDISLYAGTDAMTTSTGFSYIASGSQKTFTLEMETLTADSSSGVREYAESRDYALFHVGNEVKNDVYLSGSASTTYTYKAGYKYIFTVKLKDGGTSIYDMEVTGPQEVQMSF